MKPLILYYSKTGFTKRYASWLSEKTGGDVVPLKEAGRVQWDAYDAVVFASCLHAGRIQKLSRFQRLSLPDTPTLLLVTGATPAGSPEVEQMIRQNFPQNRDAVTVFYLPGGLCYEKMGAADRLVMKLFSAMLQKKPDKTAAEQAMAQKIASSFDNSRPDYLEPVVACLQNHC